MRVTVLDEPDLEFGSAGRHIEQRAGVDLHGPADVAMDHRQAEIRVGVVGAIRHVDEVVEWLKSTSSRGVPGKDSRLATLYPAFPGCTPSLGFLAQLSLPKEARRPLTRARLSAITSASTDLERLINAVALCADEVRNLHDRAAVDVVVVVRPDGTPSGVPDGSVTGGDFHDLLKAALIDCRQPIQIIRPATWKGARGVEDPATTAWNFFTALYYKAGGKPWRLARAHDRPTRCFIGVAFTRTDDDESLFTSVAQVFNELGDGVIVRGGLARRSGADRQPHLSRDDARQLLLSALAQYKTEHRTLPAAISLHKTSSFSTDERSGFLAARDETGLSECELLWLTSGDDAMLIRGSHYHPPLRGTLLTLNDEEHALYTHGSVPYYKTYPGLYVPGTVGIRPDVSDRSIDEIATEILALTKLNWNRARMDGKQPITLMTARRVGGILRHVPSTTAPAVRYANYM